MIEGAIAPHDAIEAFELLWSFVQLAPSIHERTDDSNGAIGDVMAEAVDMIAQLAPRLSMDQETLAERILEAVADAGYGEFDGIIPATAEALGTGGLTHLEADRQRLGRRAPNGRGAGWYQRLWILVVARRSRSAQQAGHDVGHPGRCRGRTRRRRRLYVALLTRTADLRDDRA